MKKFLLLFALGLTFGLAQAQWALTGNAGTNPATHFVGTTDTASLIFRVGGTPSGRIDFNKSNVFMGYQAGINTSGIRNTKIGNQAGPSISTGSSNCFFGFQSGINTTSGTGNVFLGDHAGTGTATGDNNVAVGTSAGSSNTTGFFNIFLGDNAQPSATGLTNAIAIGHNSIVSASNSMVLGNGVNVGIGTSSPAEKLHVVGSLRMEDGNQAAGKILTSDASGKASWQVPAPASPAGSAGGDLGGTYPNPSVVKIQGFSISPVAPTHGKVLQYNNLNSRWEPTTPTVDWSPFGNAGLNPATNFIGTTDNVSLNFRVNNSRAGVIETTGNNTAFGLGAGPSSFSTSSENTLYGANAGNAISSGTGNTLIGSGAGKLGSTLTSSTYIGFNAGAASTTSGNNTFVGKEAGTANTTGSQNTFIGTQAGLSSTTSNQNTYVGFSAGRVFTGTLNTMLGDGAGIAGTTGDQNTFLGTRAANTMTTGSNNTVVGAFATVGTSRNNGIAIGQNASVTSDNCAVIGNTSITKFGIGKTPGITNILEFQVTTAKLTTGGVWTNASDRRIKDNVTQLNKKEVLEKIENLEVARWHYKADAEPVTHIGPMSQDFYAAFKTGDETTISTIDPSGVALIGIQQLSIENKELRKENEALKSRLDKFEAMLASNQTTTHKLVLEAAGKTAMLGQNFPNPVTGKTTIEYFLPASTKSAKLLITSNSGVQLVAEIISNRGNGSVELDASKLANGSYFYSLVVDGEKVDSKQFSLIK